ncbi:hypothetical protein E2C01_100293 [Portunus trituberculatus]|uniref:Uncharacterized protein n=1 Tax=Portunus trituberculatus TaxID=210409 RepID=A0A5B7KD73_PORTR|nr:hypothetical protein [Portunus trituberculatus]
MHYISCGLEERVPDVLLSKLTAWETGCGHLHLGLPHLEGANTDFDPSLIAEGVKRLWEFVRLR